MLFNSYIFILCFLPLSLLIFFYLAKLRLIRLSLGWLLISSLLFYAYGNLFPSQNQPSTPEFLLLILLSVIVNHQIGTLINSTKLTREKAKLWLWIGLVFNISLLAYFKYTNFFVSNIQSFFNVSWTIPKISFPLAISFYTFTQIAYLVDVYRGETKDRHYSLPTYSLFVLFFPELIAGPIVRHHQLIPQFHQLRSFVFSHKNLALGLTLFSLGLAKKVLIADRLSPWVTLVFNNAAAVNFTEAWVGALSYTLQLYFDFSGYSDMAIGVALMFNIQLPINFNSPYKSISIVDFWRRWHITLSYFLRDYLYIPLGGSRRGEIRRYFNLIVTMLLGGLWHGAGWTFVLWGGLHGVYLSINHGWRKLNFTLPQLVGWLITFLAIVVGWVVFRAQNLQDATAILKAMFGLEGVVIPGRTDGRFAWLSHIGLQLQAWDKFSYLSENIKQNLVLLTGLLIAVFFLPNTNEIINKLSPSRWLAVGVGLLLCLCLFSLNQVTEFLYFQF